MSSARLCQLLLLPAPCRVQIAEAVRQNENAVWLSSVATSSSRGSKLGPSSIRGDIACPTCWLCFLLLLLVIVHSPAHFGTGLWAFLWLLSCGSFSLFVSAFPPLSLALSLFLPYTHVANNIDNCQRFAAVAVTHTHSHTPTHSLTHTHSMTHYHWMRSYQARFQLSDRQRRRQRGLFTHQGPHSHSHSDWHKPLYFLTFVSFSFSHFHLWCKIHEDIFHRNMYESRCTLEKKTRSWS